MKHIKDEMNELENLTIRPLSADLLPDYLSFLDHEAFADNPKWATCYCHFNQAPHQAQDWNERTGEENRAAAVELICARRMQGHLAYLEDQPVAWCNAAPRTFYTTLKDDDEPLADRIGSIVCFVVAKPHRGKGIARRLLAAACEGFRLQGLEIAEAFPRKDTQDEAANYHGPLSMYLALGFQPVRESGNFVVVRKSL